MTGGDYSLDYSDSEEFRGADGWRLATGLFSKISTEELHGADGWRFFTGLFMNRSTGLFEPARCDELAVEARNLLPDHIRALQFMTGTAAMTVH